MNMKLAGIALVALGLAAAAAGNGAPPAGAAGKEPGVGDAAPAFTLAGSDGKTYALADFKGTRAVVLAWFPKAFTGG